MADLCGAKTRSGEPCKRAPIAGKKRCKLHGGATVGSGSPPGNTNAVKHGFYSDALPADERLLYERVEIGSIDDEIRLARVKLHRFVRLSASVELSDLVDGALELVNKTGIAFDAETQQMEAFDKKEIKAVAPNYADFVIKLIEQVRKLEMSRWQMNAGKPPENPGADMTRDDTFIAPDEPIPSAPIL